MLIKNTKTKKQLMSTYDMDTKLHNIAATLLNGGYYAQFALREIDDELPKVWMEDSADDEKYCGWLKNAMENGSTFYMLVDLIWPRTWRGGSH